MGNLTRSTAQIEAALDKAESAVQSSALAKVATSGSYNDLNNKPTIPSAVTESTVSGWGFTKNAGTVTAVKLNGTTYSPSSGVVDLGTISGGSGGGDSYAGNYPKVTQASGSISPNTYTIINYALISSLQITLAAPTNTSIINEYIVAFYAKTSGASVLVPSSVVWVNGDAPTIEANCTYVISIVDNIAMYIKAAGNIYNIQGAGGGGAD